MRAGWRKPTRLYICPQKGYNEFMQNYSGTAVDQYMRVVLEQDLSPDQTDNALTLLTTLTSLASPQFPHEKTFIRVNKTRLLFHPETVRVRGITLFTLKEDGTERAVSIPKDDLRNIKTAMASLFAILGDGLSLDDL